MCSVRWASGFHLLQPFFAPVREFCRFCFILISCAPLLPIQSKQFLYWVLFNYEYCLQFLWECLNHPFGHFSLHPKALKWGQRQARVYLWMAHHCERFFSETAHFSPASTNSLASQSGFAIFFENQIAFLLSRTLNIFINLHKINNSSQKSGSAFTSEKKEHKRALRQKSAKIYLAAPFCRKVHCGEQRETGKSVFLLSARIVVMITSAGVKCVLIKRAAFDLALHIFWVDIAGQLPAQQNNCIVVMLVSLGPMYTH